MTRRSVAAVILLTFVTFGIYALFWLVKTKEEMCDKGADIPTALLLIVPLVNIWWMWKYAEGVDRVTNSEMSAPIAFILLILLSWIGIGIIQSQFNRLQPAIA